MLKRAFLAASLFVAVSGGTALAGPQYVDDTGYAISGYDTVAFFDLKQAPIGEPQPHAVKGKTEYTAEYNGAKWAFENKANLDKFKADPAKYAPQFDGHCAYGVAVGGKVPANPNLWRIVDGKLYMNITPTIVGFWTSDVDGNITKADTNWGGIEKDAASADGWKSIKDNDGTYDGAAPTK